jgi:hypothetical protein
LKALDMIVQQGEGGDGGDFGLPFGALPHDAAGMAGARGAPSALFAAHPAAQDRVMRRPSDRLERVWVTSPPANRLRDLGNPLYGQTLVRSQQAYAIEPR